MNNIGTTIQLTFLAVLLLVTLSSVAFAADIPQTAGTPQQFSVESSAFENHAKIPFRYTNYGDNISPQIRWSGLPEETRELALVMEDPFAPTPEPFVHWVVYNIPATARMLPEGLSSNARVEQPCSLCGTINGLNGTDEPGYFGPRPPVGDGVLHAYDTWVYALDEDLDLQPGLGKEGLMEAIEDHIVGVGRIMGHYEHVEE